MEKSNKPAFALDFEQPVQRLRERFEEMVRLTEESGCSVGPEMEAMRVRIDDTLRRIYGELTPWQRVQVARHPRRPYALDYINALFDDFQELHGDRNFGDDQAMIGGTAWFEGRPVMIIAQQKGRDTRENLARNFGMPHPEGYRKALRLMKLAEKFRLPVLLFIDTKAAFAGIGSEERHVSEAIARNLMEMSMLETPTLGMIIGEGGSGGALGIGVVDYLMVMEYAYYSVIPPEGCAAILWRSREFTERATEALRLGGHELVEQGIADEMIPEPLGGAHSDPDAAADTLRKAISKNLAALCKVPVDEMLRRRYAKYRVMGVFAEEHEAADGIACAG
ncbi:MAG: acetyl-CoA carboxylase carboxyltransferase subunit alpha [Opitutales bacterium]|jgi:acetyl-CoA carboxylase carboxyl transferase subunit alpha